MLDKSSMHFIFKEGKRLGERFCQWFSKITKRKQKYENKTFKGKRKLSKNNYLALQNPNQELIVIITTAQHPPLCDIYQTGQSELNVLHTTAQHSLPD